MADNYMTVKCIQHYSKMLSSQKVMSTAKEKVEQQHKDKMESLKNKNNKWSNFRVEKQKVIDLYIDAVKKSRAQREMLKMASLVLSVKKVN